jgi:hypothetical protein
MYMSSTTSTSTSTAVAVNVDVIAGPISLVGNVEGASSYGTININSMMLVTKNKNFMVAYSVSAGGGILSVFRMALGTTGFTGTLLGTDVTTNLGLDGITAVNINGGYPVTYCEQYSDTLHMATQTITGTPPVIARAAALGAQAGVVTQCIFDLDLVQYTDVNAATITPALVTYKYYYGPPTSGLFTSTPNPWMRTAENEVIAQTSQNISSSNRRVLQIWRAV